MSMLSHPPGRTTRSHSWFGASTWPQHRTASVSERLVLRTDDDAASGRTNCHTAIMVQKIAVTLDRKTVDELDRRQEQRMAEDSLIELIG